MMKKCVIYISIVEVNYFLKNCLYILFNIKIIVENIKLYNNSGVVVFYICFFVCLNRFLFRWLFNINKNCKK